MQTSGLWILRWFISTAWKSTTFWRYGGLLLSPTPFRWSCFLCHPLSVFIAISCLHFSISRSLNLDLSISISRSRSLSPSICLCLSEALLIDSYGRIRQTRIKSSTTSPRWKFWRDRMLHTSLVHFRFVKLKQFSIVFEKYVILVDLWRFSILDELQMPPSARWCPLLPAFTHFGTFNIANRLCDIYIQGCFVWKLLFQAHRSWLLARLVSGFCFCLLHC